MKIHRIQNILDNVRKRLQQRRAGREVSGIGKKNWIEQIRRSAEGKRHDLHNRLALDVLARVRNTEGGSEIPEGMPRLSRRKASHRGGDTDGAEVFVYDRLTGNNERVREVVSLKDPAALLQKAKDDLQMAETLPVDEPKGD